MRLTAAAAAAGAQDKSRDGIGPVRVVHMCESSIN
jgi:hypothetical protein